MSDPMPTIYHIIGWAERMYGTAERQRYGDETESDGHGTDD